jgi:hypothetical protein
LLVIIRLNSGAQNEALASAVAPTLEPPASLFDPQLVDYFFSDNDSEEEDEYAELVLS